MCIYSTVSTQPGTVICVACVSGLTHIGHISVAYLSVTHSSCTCIRLLNQATHVCLGTLLLLLVRISSFLLQAISFSKFREIRILKKKTVLPRAVLYCSIGFSLRNECVFYLFIIIVSLRTTATFLSFFFNSWFSKTKTFAFRRDSKNFQGI